jgi:phage tail-like protein
MARRATDGIEARYSLAGAIPGLYHDDEFFMNLVDAFDMVLAPIQAVVDDLDAYIDPLTAPPDLLEWVGSWMGLTVNRRWPVQRRREFVARALSVYLWRGTRRGIEEAVELYTGSRPEVTDSGGVSASPEPLGPMPGSARREVVVVVRTKDPSIDADLVDRIVADVKPAHVHHRVEVRRSRTRSSGPGTR